jgi:hypothetical protein
MQRQTLRATIIIALFTTAIMLLPACKSEEQRQEEARWHMNTPLPHDPMDQDVLGPWWSNGEQLLHLQDNHFYALYDGNNRYAKPRERGRWDQEGYAVLWLEPYSRIERGRTRVSVTKIDGRLALVIPKLRPMHALEDGPPPAREDALIGSWQGPMGALSLNADMTYTFRPAAGAAVEGRALAGHNGRWSLQDGEITLTPATTALKPVTLKVRDVPPPAAAAPSDTTQPAMPDAVLEGLGGELVKVKAATA